jgi:hypothetical protein
LSNLSSISTQYFFEKYGDKLAYLFTHEQVHHPLRGTSHYSLRLSRQRILAI